MTKNQQIHPDQLVELYRRALEQGIPLDKLEEKIARKLDRVAVSTKIEKKEEQERVKEVRQRLPKAVRYGALTVPVLFILVGLFLLGNALLPIVQYYTTTLPSMSKPKMLSPIPYEEILDVTPYVIAQTDTSEMNVLGNKSSTGPIILDTELDFTDLANWFEDEQAALLASATEADSYILEIPKLEIEEAEVKIGGTDLDQSLIAYPGTAEPGSPGAPVIFGHSVLRQFYNPSPKNPRRYNSIFSYIMTLERGDEILVTHQGATFKYVVKDKSEVKPEDTYILAQQYDHKLLKLVTCVPEGTYLRRGVVTAELVAN